MSEQRVRGRPNLSAYLAEQIQHMIRHRQLGPGDRLPPARALAEQFQVATPTMREALRRLQVTGVVDIRHGSGIYVRRDRERLMLANTAYGTLEHFTVLQLLDARLLIEPRVAALAAGNATGDDLQTIDQIIAEGGQVLASGADRYFQVNAQFHTTVAQASGNVVLAQIVESLVELYSSELWAVDPARTLEEVRSEDHQGHVQIAEALQARDLQRTEEAMRRHLLTARGRIEQRLSLAAAGSDRPHERQGHP